MNEAFEWLETTPLPEYRSEGRFFRHKRTGCEVYHVANEDEENLFAFAFKTPPPDSTGVAHILEHTVLCGSHRFPLKDPFLYLLKGSMNTFLNALTFPDKTVYPASSTVEKDLFNIMQVYGDAVFFPLLREEMFRQEGHRLQYDEGGRLERTGVVYNEMKGNYSSQDSVEAEWGIRSVLPDTPYGHDSGGDPAVIPELDYERFLEFHKQYYHPSNTRIFLYGNIPSERYLDFLEDEFLSHFDANPIDVEVPEQPRWSEPQRLQKSFASDPEEDPGGKSSVTLNWLLPPVTDTERAFAFEVLTEILLGHSGAPLQRAIVESDLGEDMSASTGIETELRELVFSAGIRGTDPSREADVEALILGELRRVRDEGLDPEGVEAALRRVEFRNREIKGGPFGLRLMRRAFRGWMHGTPPDATLGFTEPFERLRARVAEEPRYFEQLIDRYLLQNPHRTTLVVVPDPEQGERDREAEAQQLRELEGSFDPSSIERIRAEQQALDELQKQPDAPEDVSRLPFLTVSDVPREVETIDHRRGALEGGQTLLEHHLFTNGIVYLDLAFPLEGLTAEDSRWLPLFCAALTECGLSDMPYHELTRALSMHTGGVSAHAEVSPSLDEGADRPGPPRQYLFVRMKALERSLEDATDLLSRVLRDADFTATDRLSDLIQELRNEHRSSVIPGGHSYAALRSAAALSPSAHIEEQWSGISQLQHLAAVDETTQAADIGATLARMRELVFRPDGLVAGITASEDAIADARAAVKRVVEELPGSSRSQAGEAGTAAPSARAHTVAGEAPRVESLLVPASVNYVAAAFAGAPITLPDYSGDLILSHLLKTGLLWEYVRMRGGAYGAVAATRSLEGVFLFASYRDPQLLQTLQAYRDALEALAQEPVSEDELELAIIGTVGAQIRPFAPGEKGMISLKRHLFGIRDELRQAKRDELLAMQPEQVRLAAERLLDAFSEKRVAVIGSREAVEEAGKEMPELLEHVTQIPM